MECVGRGPGKAHLLWGSHGKKGRDQAVAESGPASHSGEISHLNINIRTAEPRGWLPRTTTHSVISLPLQIGAPPAATPSEGSLERESHDWMEGARIGEATNPRPSSWQDRQGGNPPAVPCTAGEYEH